VTTEWWHAAVVSQIHACCPLAPRRRFPARRMGDSALRQRGRGVPARGTRARRRVPVRPEDLRHLRRLLGV